MPSFADLDLIITGIIDGPLTGGFPKAVELYCLNDIPSAELARYQLAINNNGGGLPFNSVSNIDATSLTAGDFYYISQETSGFTTFFGFGPDQTGGVNHNGDDAFFILKDGVIVDQIGLLNVDGTGEPWDTVDGWAYRMDGSGPDSNGFVESSWTFKKNIWNGENTNADAGSDAFPIGTYTP